MNGNEVLNNFVTVHFGSWSEAMDLLSIHYYFLFFFEDYVTLAYPVAMI